MNINMIAAVGKNGQIGLAGKIPWSFPDDLAWFQRLTSNGILLAGRNTIESVRHLDKTHGGLPNA